eukprot:scaffold99449_cov18-Tisochrysis_lutea.AAC.1
MLLCALAVTAQSERDRSSWSSGVVLVGLAEERAPLKHAGQCVLAEVVLVGLAGQVEVEGGVRDLSEGGTGLQLSSQHRLVGVRDAAHGGAKAAAKKGQLNAEVWKDLLGVHAAVVQVVGAGFCVDAAAVPSAAVPPAVAVPVGAALPATPSSLLLLDS